MMDEDIKIIDNVEEALSLIKNKEILLLYQNNRKCYFILKNNKITVVDVNAKYSLEFEEFLKLFEKNQFIVFENKEEEFDSTSDDQYYSWKHK